MTLLDIILWVITGGGAGVLAYALIKHAPPKWRAWFESLSTDMRRYAAFIVAGLLGVAFEVIAIGMQYVIKPPTWRDWVETLVATFMTAGASIIVSQIAHAKGELSRRL